MSRLAYVNKHKLVTPKGGVGHSPLENADVINRAISPSGQ